MKSRARGFTLVELLVVIAIITILAAFLLPVLQKTVETARQATCLNNQKQLGSAFIAYASDNREYMPLWEVKRNFFFWSEWYKLYYPYITPKLLFPSEPYMKPDNRHPREVGRQVPIFDCPSTNATVQYHFSTDVYHPYKYRKVFDYLCNYLPIISRTSRPAGNYRLNDLKPKGFLLIESYALDGFHSMRLYDYDPTLFYSATLMDCTRLSNTSVSLQDNGRRSPGIHHNEGCNLLYPDNHARHAKAREYLPGFFSPFSATDRFTINYLVE